ncbi:hypothetical protein ACFL4E_03435 [Candidatus Omnitrophota bacterium]
MESTLLTIEQLFDIFKDEGCTVEVLQLDRETVTVRVWKPGDYSLSVIKTGSDPRIALQEALDEII